MPEAPPQAAGSDGPQQAPMGVSSATGPTPNRGYEAAVIQRLGSIANQLAEMVPMVGATSELGQALMKGISLFAKHVPPGANNPAAEQNNLKRMMMQNQQNMQMASQGRPQAPAQGGMQPGGPPMMPRAA